MNPRGPHDRVFKRLHCGRLGADVRTEEVLTTALTTVDTDLERAHEILARQHRMQLVPPDAVGLCNRPVDNGLPFV